MVSKEIKENGRNVIISCAVLIALVLAVYAQCGGFQLVTYDDPGYVTQNTAVVQGLSLDNIVHEFTSFDQFNYHPLTMVSHMADTTLFGGGAGARHIVNVFLHMLNVLLLFFFLLRAVTAGGIKNGLYPSFFVAALFAVHPMHIESVAWISERKDVLCAFFWLLAMNSWVSYTRHEKKSFYAVTFVLTGLAILAKPMAVTLPAALILIDVWPLGRINILNSSPNRIISDICRLVLEKIPLLALSALSAVLTLMAQKSGGAMQTFDAFPFGLRFANALTSWVSYAVKMFAPADLAPFYPYPLTIPVWQSGAALLVLAAVSFFALRTVRKVPYFAVGWFWFLGTLVPVIGLVQVGDQAMADRYAYIPYIGLYCIIVFGIAELVKRGKIPAKAAAITGIAVICLLTTLAHVQASYWKDSDTLYKHALAVTEKNHHMEFNYANLLDRRGEHTEAAKHFIKAIEADPGHYKAMVNLGNIYNRRNRVNEALAYYDKAIALNNTYAPAYANRGIAYHKLGRYSQAMNDYRHALELNPNLADAMVNMGSLEFSRGNNGKALELYKRALKIDPENRAALKNMEQLK